MNQKILIISIRIFVISIRIMTESLPKNSTGNSRIPINTTRLFFRKLFYEKIFSLYLANIYTRKIFFEIFQRLPRIFHQEMKEISFVFLERKCYRDFRARECLFHYRKLLMEKSLKDSRLITRIYEQDGVRYLTTD